jgi:hypothetical protein
LPAQANIGLPINPLVVTSTLILNGIGGLVFGWLFFTLGLESAILAHILADILRYSLIPFISMQQGEIARTLVMAGVIIVVLLAFVWAWKTLVEENRRQATAIGLKGI